MSESCMTQVQADDLSEIIENRKRAINALIKDPGEQCFTSLFHDYQEWDEVTGSFNGPTHVQACAVGVLVREFFGISTNEELLTYLRDHPEFDPYTSVADKLGIVQEPRTMEEYEDTVSVRKIWMKNDREERSFADIGNWLKEQFNL